MGTRTKLSRHEGETVTAMNNTVETCSKDDEMNGEDGGRMTREEDIKAERSKG